MLDILTKVLVALYEKPEKPNSALEFLKHHLGAATSGNLETGLLHLELAEMTEKYETIVEENKKESLEFRGEGWLERNIWELAAC